MGICPFVQFTIFYTILSVFARFFAQFQTAFYRLVNDNYRVGKEKMILRGDFQLSGRIGNTCLSVLSRQLNLNTGGPHSLYFFYLSLIIVTPTFLSDFNLDNYIYSSSHKNPPSYDGGFLR